MSLYICSLNSGSNANCYYIGNTNEAVLVDAGLSCRETEKRMKLSGLSMSTVKALFVSHEHSDHITGIPALSKKYQLPVYITSATFKNAKIPVEPVLIKNFKADLTITIGNLLITPFSKSHDADDPHSFMISSNNINIGVITDIGYACKQVIKYFKQCDVAFLEANYCADMLEKGNYPYHLKKRISSKRGHLSNDQALDLFNQYRSDKLSLLILSHLSKNNNSPQLVEKIFGTHAGNTRIIIASRYKATEVFKIDPHAATSAKIVSLRKPTPQKTQLSLF
jgi:phosphoribosyl 1,2-cyclic phosphodiesterase